MRPLPVISRLRPLELPAVTLTATTLGLTRCTALTVALRRRSSTFSVAAARPTNSDTATRAAAQCDGNRYMMLILSAAWRPPCYPRVVPEVHSFPPPPRDGFSFSG